MPPDEDLVEMPDIDFIVDQISAKYSGKLVKLKDSSKHITQLH